MNNAILSPLECNIMRGIAILAIITNNFGHMITGVYEDNEFTYNYDNVIAFISLLHDYNSTLPFNILSFYSPFGVMLFIFLSGYGLTLKYESKMGYSTDCTSFIINHYKKLFIMQTKGLAIFYLIFILFFKDTIIYVLPLIKQLLLIGNITGSPIHPGPFWFFGMIIEIYIIYRLFLFRRSSLFIIIVSILSLVLMALFEPYGDTMSFLRINFGMAILPFCLGILAARHIHPNIITTPKSSLLYWFYLFLSMILLTLCKFNFYSWLIMPIFIIFVAFFIVKIISKVNILSQIFNWIGALSGVLFVIHPTIREIIIPRANEFNHPNEIFIYLFLTIVLSVILRPIFINKDSSVTRLGNNKSTEYKDTH